jgi:hypothetical protein
MKHFPTERRIMADECVVAVYRKLDQAREAIQKLTASGFPATQVSLVTAGLKDRPELLRELELGDDSIHDAAVAAELGGVVGVLSGLAVMVVTGLGAVFLVGPVGGAIVGSLTGGFIGAMAGWGVHEHQVKHYERLIEAGNVLVVANGNPLDLVHAYRQLEGTGASELHTYARSDDEASVEA